MGKSYLYIIFALETNTPQTMDKIARRLRTLSREVLACSSAKAEDGAALTAELVLIKELSKTHKLFEASVCDDKLVEERLNVLTEKILAPKSDRADFDAPSYVDELKLLQELLRAWDSAGGISIVDDGDEEVRKSTAVWDAKEGKTFTTEIKLTDRQRECLGYLEAGLYDKFLAVGGSGSGKSFILVYYVVRETLRHKAPCLIGRDKMIDLSQGVIDQILPAIFTLIATANKVDDWKKWTIDGLKFAKWTDKKTKLEFATGGYIRVAGLSIRDLSESGSDKILSPSWLHILLEEVSELEYGIVEKVLTRLRYNVPGVLNTLLLCENPPSINHWSYRRFFEGKREDGSVMGSEERDSMMYLLMNPGDNLENLSTAYIKNLSEMSGANYERFYLGKFQDTESGDIFKYIDWTDVMPRNFEWEKLIVYTDPTPLTNKDHSVYADFKASVLMGLFNGETFVIDVRLVKGSTLDMLQSIKQLWDISPNQSITDVVMEDKQVPSDFKQVWENFAQTTQWFVPIKRDKRRFGEKKSTIEQFLQPLFEHEMIHFSKAFRDTERGRQTQFQILKFSRKANKNVHDDVPDAIMRGDTYMKGRAGKRVKRPKELVKFTKPGFIMKS